MMPSPRAALRRRELLAGALALGPVLYLAGTRFRTAAAAAPLGEPKPFSAELLREHARALAQVPYQPPAEELPGALAELSYDQHRDIRFRRAMALWHGEPVDVEVQFFHLGYQLKTPVHIHEVVDGTAREVLYSAELFDFGQNDFDTDFPSDLGFAGFRIHVPLNRPDYLDELVAFLGASYFRALGRGQRYGLSARGLAINTGLPSGEEFPWFRAFWLERPQSAEHLVVHALLDGPSVAGAYTFVIAPGVTTRMDVRASLYPREPVELLGIAPLTSMFLFGTSDRRGVDDFRPNVHDSEGLQLRTSRDEWIWRPLVNPERLRLSIFRDENPKGFGLLQRTREFDAYQDLESHYELRPSLWVEPKGPWGRGHVRLLEIPSNEEIHDNIVAFWAPEAPLEPGAELELNYRLFWCAQPPETPSVAHVQETRIGAGGVPGQERDPTHRKFVIDFVGGQVEALPGDAAVTAVLSASAGKTTPPVVQKNGITGGWRVFFDLVPEGATVVELRCHLQLDDEVLTETWAFQWSGE